MAALSVLPATLKMSSREKSHPNKNVIPSLTTNSVSRRILATPIVSAREEGFDFPFPQRLWGCFCF
jgi:hypothetical protein